MNTFLAKFNFTTCRGNSFTRREGQVEMESDLSLNELDMEEVKQLCVNFVYSIKPKWNIFMLDVMSVEPFEPKKKKTNT